MTKIMKWISIAMLLLAVFQFRIVSNQVFLTIVVCASSLLVAMQAFHAGKYAWAVGFLAVAVLFNPFVPLARSGSEVLWLNGFGLAAFLMAEVAMKVRPALTVPSMTNRLPRRESL
ncbi:MAG TPA: DUF6804 family protein [Terriglobia bacterium]|nr:DUF6804 family protein [Terriglobia bacterium]